MIWILQGKDIVTLPPKGRRRCVGAKDGRMCIVDIPMGRERCFFCMKTIRLRMGAV